MTAKRLKWGGFFLQMDVDLGVTDYKNIIATVTGAPQGGGFGAVKIVAWVIFGAIGFVAFSYGKKSGSMKPMLIGGALLAYPYFFTGTWPLYMIGTLLTAALYFWRE
jgi:hypothetical protein